MPQQRASEPLQNNDLKTDENLLLSPSGKQDDATMPPAPIKEHLNVALLKWGVVARRRQIADRNIAEKEQKHASMKRAKRDD